jgi:uncharacterized protein
MEAWQTNLVESQTAIEAILRDTRTIAVLGIKPESHSWAPAHFVPAYLLRAGFDVIPVPVYYPDVKVILGLPVVRKLEEIDRPIDMVNVFRRSNDIPPHVESLLTVKPKYVWFQSGIRNDAAAERLARAGIKVVQDRCLMVEHSG